MVYAYVVIVHPQANEILRQLLMNNLGTLPSHCSFIKRMHEEIWLKSIFDRTIAMRT